MLRPFAAISVIDSGKKAYNLFAGSNVQYFFYKFSAKVSDLEITENREGIVAKFQLVNDRYIINPGDKIEIDVGYKGINSVKYPVMIVTQVNIDNNLQLQITCVDEFTYYIQTTQFIPTLSETDDAFKQVQKYLQDNFNIPYGDDANFIAKKLPTEIDTYTLLAYIERLIYPKMYKSKPQYRLDSDIKFKNETYMYNLVDPDVKVGSIGTFTNLNSTTRVIDILKILKETFFIKIYQASSAYNKMGSKDKYKDISVMIEPVGAINKYKSKVLLLEDNNNIINDSLTYNNPVKSDRFFKAIYKYKNDKKVDVVEEWVGYYDLTGKIVVKNIKDLSKTDKEIIKNKIADKLEVGNAKSLTEESKVLYITNILKSRNYYGYVGIINTFFNDLNLNSIIELKFNNIARGIEHKDDSVTGRIGGFFAINELNISYSSESGLFMDIQPRQRLSYDTSKNIYLEYGDTIK